jgi:hypothetical protein
MKKQPARATITHQKKKTQRKTATPTKRELSTMKEGLFDILHHMAIESEETREEDLTKIDRALLAWHKRKDLNSIKAMTWLLDVTSGRKPVSPLHAAA